MELTQNLFYPAISVGDIQASFGDPVKIENTMEALLNAVKVSENLSELPLSTDIEVLSTSGWGGSKYMVRYNKVLVGMMLYPLAEHLDNFVDTTGTAQEDVELLAKACVESPQPPLNAKEWVDKLRQFGASNPELVILIDSMPGCLADLSKVGSTHVIVPNSDNITEEQYRAVRPIFLLAEADGPTKGDAVRNSLSIYPWLTENLPTWFKTHNDHVTKGDRTNLTYHLMLQGYLNPPTRKPFVRTEAVNRPSNYGFELTLKTATDEMIIARNFGTSLYPAKNNTPFNLAVNRHQLPDNWKHLFKKDAVNIKGTVVIDEKGFPKLDSPIVTVNPKHSHLNDVAWKLEVQHYLPQ